MSTGKRTWREAVWRYPVFFCLLLVAPQAFPQDTKEKMNNTRKQLEEEIENTTTLLDQTKKSKETSLRDLQLLNRRIEKREALIHTIRGEINDADREIKIDNILIERRSAELQSLKDEYARMIYYAYRTMNAQNRLLFIFSARDFNQAYQRLRYYQQYTGYRRKQAERIREAQMALSRQRQELESVRSQKVKLALSEVSEKNKLDGEKKLKDRTIQELSRKEKQLLATLRSKQLALSKLQAEIERIIAEEARAKSGNKSKEPASSAGDIRLSTSFAANKGNLPWPAEKGIVSSTFGEHAHPVLKYVKVKNDGIDIMVSPGAPVKAVFNGTVSRILSIPNLNKVVILRHGDYLTVYSNLDEVSVMAGQMVSTGQVLGKTHYDSEEGKSELNFQIWLGKTILNPQDWLSN